MHYAATEGHLDVLHVLVAGGADVTLRDKDGTAAAFRANVNGHSDVVSYLIERGDPEMLNVDDNDDDENELKRQSYHVILYFHRHGVVTDGIFYFGDSTYIIPHGHSRILPSYSL